MNLGIRAWLKDLPPTFRNELLQQSKANPASSFQLSVKPVDV